MAKIIPSTNSKTDISIWSLTGHFYFALTPESLSAKGKALCPHRGEQARTAVHIVPGDSLALRTQPLIGIVHAMNADLHIVLFEPEIPPNTGNISRLCACTGIQLHLVHPLGFDIDEKQLKRAGLDYWPYLNVREHADWSAVRRELHGHRWFGLTTRGGQTVWETAFMPGDVLVMGPETRGLPDSVLSDIRPLRIPMREDAPVRSLNLSSACAIVAYEALRQLNT